MKSGLKAGRLRVFSNRPSSNLSSPPSSNRSSSANSARSMRPTRKRFAAPSRAFSDDDRAMANPRTPAAGGRGFHVPLISCGAARDSRTRYHASNAFAAGNRAAMVACDWHKCTQGRRMSNDRAARGKKIRDQAFGKDGRKTWDELNAICPTHAQAIHEYCFGTIWDRPHLDLKTRELIVIAAAVEIGRASCRERGKR